MNKPKPLYYADYIQLEKLLSSQAPKSVEVGKQAHDEMLFIIVHQVFELWFKEILYELDSIRNIFAQDYIDEKQIGIAVSRLQRITEIQNLLIDQVRVLETMTPLDFLDFRDLLYPASGFQSFQFRLIENKMGLHPEQRMLYNKEAYYAALSLEHQEMIKRSEREPSLFDLMEKWLGRTPFLDFHGFNFWDHYRAAVENILACDRDRILSDPLTSEEEKKKQLKELFTNEENFVALLDERKHNELVRQNRRRLSHRAIQAALLIQLYRDEPILHLPFMLLTVLVDIDELFTTWRYRHAIMVHRMIGTKIGTGGSTGYSYLKATVDRYKVFADLFNLSTFLIPRSALLALPKELKKNLGFYYSTQRQTV
ncbi:MAG TPA: tryptophan 2,3-dioxygenase family protein [Bacteroidota bacterium]|nr:tryptophan 2,3-dioxygenase family protein [Bacteroidota bacterium]